MKKLFFIAVAVMAMAACTKKEVNQVVRDNAITFQTATYLPTSTKASGSVFATNKTFGTYAWSDNQLFMNNIEVKYNSKGQWAPVTVFYWPKNEQTVDFVSYHPFSDVTVNHVPIVEQNKITYEDIDFSLSINQKDYMYADKAVGYHDNGTGEEITDSDNVNTESGLAGVPTLFRHAGAKLAINCTTTYDYLAAAGDTTKFEITIKQAYLTGIYTKGTCELNLSDANKTGIVTWNKPANNVWVADETVVNDPNATMFKINGTPQLKKGENVPIMAETYILPQTLVADQQMLHFIIDAKTYLKRANETEYSLILEQTEEKNKAIKADISLIMGNIFAWEMNGSYEYTIYFGPASSPITFDPAVVDWKNYEESSSIELNLTL